jgi:hypothetical protein
LIRQSIPERVISRQGERFRFNIATGNQTMSFATLSGAQEYRVQYCDTLN